MRTARRIQCKLSPAPPEAQPNAALTTPSAAPERAGARPVNSLFSGRAGRLRPGRFSESILPLPSSVRTHGDATQPPRNHPGDTARAPCKRLEPASVRSPTLLAAASSARKILSESSGLTLASGPSARWFLLFTAQSERKGIPPDSAGT